MDDIIMGIKLSDKDIGLAQDRLKSRFGNTNGLECCTLRQSKNSIQSEDTIKNKVQIFHDRDDH